MSSPAGAGARLSRLLALVPWLLSRPGITLTEAADHFGVTTDALVADLDLLICSGPGQQHGELVDIWYWDDGTVKVLDPQSLGRPLRLTAEEAAALLVALRVLAQVPGGHDRALIDSVTAKLEDAAGAAAAGRAAVSVTVEERVDPAVAECVRRALDEQRALHIRYAGAARDQVSERVVDPVALLSVDGRPYLSAWCRSAGASRTFRLDRILACDLRDEPAAVPAEAAPPELGRDGLRPAGAAVTLDLLAGARWVAEEYPVDQVQPRAGGAVRVTLPVADERWIVRLLLRLGADARVVSPPQLADRVAAAAREALAAYPTPSDSEV